jgi:integrase
MTNEAKVIALPGAAPKPKRRRKTKRSQGSVYDRNGRWYMQFRVTDPASGVRSRPTEPIQGATDRATAVLALEARLRSLADGSYFVKPKAPPRTLNGAADEFQAWADAEKRSASRDRLSLAHLRATFGDRPVTAITTRDLETYRIARVKEIVTRKIAAHEGADTDPEAREAAKRSARSTVNREIACARTLFNRLVRSGELDANANPLGTGKLPQYGEAENARNLYLAPEAAAQLEAACTEPFRSFVVLAIHTGLRRGELLRLRRDDVDLGAGVLHVRRAKSGKPRPVRLSATARETLSKLIEQTNGAYLFGGETPASIEWVKSAWKRAVKRAGLSGVRLHDLRHACGSWAVAAGTPLSVVRESLGHSSLKVTERYLHTAPQHHQAMADALDRVWAGRPKPLNLDAGGRHVGRQEALDDTANGPRSPQPLDLKGGWVRAQRDSNPRPPDSKSEAAQRPGDATNGPERTGGPDSNSLADRSSGHEWTRDDPRSLPVADTLADNGRARLPVTPKGTPWGTLLMDPLTAAGYIGLAEAELADLHRRGVLPGVIVGGRVLFRRGDLANLGQRLAPKPRRRSRKAPAGRKGTQP